jgi:Fe-S cluster assembly scaffold protein SufB
MKLIACTAVLSLLYLNDPTRAFSQGWGRHNVADLKSTGTALHGAVGLGPDPNKTEEKKELVAGVDYEVPDHESFRTSRRSKLDEQCDSWFESLMGEDHGILGPLAEELRTLLTTPVPLINEVCNQHGRQTPPLLVGICLISHSSFLLLLFAHLPFCPLQMQKVLPRDHEEWTPYVSTKLPWTPLTPSFGLEQFGLPTPRRNAETWRHFDVAGMVEQDYSGITEHTGTEIELSDEEVVSYQAKLEAEGGWLPNDKCRARLVYINGRYAPQLSKSNDVAKNLGDIESASEEEKTWLARLTDGFTDKLAAPVPIGEDMLGESLKVLSGPDHNVGEATSQFAINAQQGTACFAALNTMRTGAVACVRAPSEVDENEANGMPVLVVNAITKDAGAVSGSEGVAFHPRTLVIAEENSRLSFVQSCVDLDTEVEHKPKMYNGYTQVFVKEGANVTHSLLEESGGVVTSRVEMSDDDLKEDQIAPRKIESERPALKDTHFETIDVQLVGEGAAYEGTLMSVGGSGRIRIAHSVSLLQPETFAKVNGFSLCGGAQRSDCKTNIHHIAQGTSSKQIQKNMIGGRATGAFRGRIRVEQSAQQTDSQQLSRTVLLSDKCRAWAVPSLEIIADDVQCTHGATVSDLSEEELFYLRSRGLDRTLSRNLLMYAFAGDVCTCIEPFMLSALGSQKGLQTRLIDRLENVVPQGERAMKGEFQSS